MKTCPINFKDYSMYILDNTKFIVIDSGVAKVRFPALVVYINLGIL